jgi:hypothetical protein
VKDAQTAIMEGMLRRLALLERRVEILAASEAGGAWRPFTYNTGWATHTGAHDFADGKYKRVGDIVFLSGVVRRSSGSSAIITTLDADCWPSERHILTTISNGAIGSIHVLADGTLSLEIGTATAYNSLCGQFFTIR